MTDFLERVVEAYGGRERWAAVTNLEIDLTITGFLFTMKMSRPLGRVRVSIDCTKPSAVIWDFPTQAQRGEWYGESAVQIVEANGVLVDRRWSPRRGFSSLRHALWWDELDFLYFAGYALWNYFTFPQLLLRADTTFEPGVPVGALRPVDVVFSEKVPTHSRRQRFWFDEAATLVRHDYTTEVLGGWATAAHLVSAHRSFDGLVFPTQRVVRPRLFGSGPLPFPDLVQMSVHDVVTGAARG